MAAPLAARSCLGRFACSAILSLVTLVFALPVGPALAALQETPSLFAEVANGESGTPGVNTELELFVALKAS